MKPFVPVENLDWFKQFIKVNSSEQMNSIAYFSSDSSNDSNTDEDESSSLARFV